jgi:hypothetical protein
LQEGIKVGRIGTFNIDWRALVDHHLTDLEGLDKSELFNIFILEHCQSPQGTLGARRLSGGSGLGQIKVSKSDFNIYVK